MENNTNNNKRYPGNRVDYQQMKVYLNRMLSNLDTRFFHYTLTLPKSQRQVDNNYTIRICHYSIFIKTNDILSIDMQNGET